MLSAINQLVMGIKGRRVLGGAGRAWGGGGGAASRGKYRFRHIVSSQSVGHGRWKVDGQGVCRGVAGGGLGLEGG